MLKIDGKYGSAIVFADNVEEGAYAQIENLVDHPIAKDAHIRIMPDVHSGIGCVIGFTAKLGEIVVPNLIGVDIGCGVLAFRYRGLKLSKSDFKQMDAIIKKEIPVGTKIRSFFSSYVPRVCQRYLGIDFYEFEKGLRRVVKRTEQDITYVLNSLGTLGSGNHFIEIDKSDGSVYFVVHSGSRNFGLNVANYHQKRARSLCKAPVPKGMEYLKGSEAKEYMEDMKIAQQYAQINRYTIMATIIDNLLGSEPHEIIESVHNYISFKDRIVRKGAISAHRGEKLLIPFNMAYGTLIGVGKGNKEWNLSAPHGAGRRMSRKQAMKRLSVKEFRKQMEDVYSSCVGKKTLDESPMAYKDVDEVLRYLPETVDLLEIAKPIYNFKAG